MKELRSLDTQIHYQGYTLTQVKQVGKYALYRVDDGTHYEVIKIQRGYPFKGTRGSSNSPSKPGPYEKYPKSEQWGVSGWTYTTLEAAENKFSSLTS